MQRGMNQQAGNRREFDPLALGAVALGGFCFVNELADMTCFFAIARPLEVLAAALAIACLVRRAYASAVVTLALAGLGIFMNARHMDMFGQDREPDVLPGQYRGAPQTLPPGR